LNRPTTPAALSAFVKAAQLGSFAAAGRHLQMSPAAVGQAVARLEAGFGVKLLNRTTRRMSLTADGRLLLERGTQLVGELDELARLFDARRGVVAGPLRVSAPLGLARRHVMPLLARFVERHPGVEASLDCSDAVRDFVDDPIDVGFRILRPTDSTLIARRIARMPALTLASSDYLRRNGTPRHPDELGRAHRVVAYRHPGSGALAPLRFRVRGRDVTLAPPPALVVNDVETGCEAAALGLGVVQPPAYYVTDALASGALVPILERHAPAPWTLFICYPGARHLPHRVRAFVDFARAELGRERWTP
jgi:LysR family transcriptional regulator, regulator for bpeEF and oprC